MTNKTEMVRVPRELLERLISATKVARGEGSPTQRAAEAILAAPAEDVCAVVDEPIAWRGCNSDGEVVTEWIDGAPPEKMFDLCGNAASFDKIERAYSHPQRPVVMPEKYDDVLLPFLVLMRAELHANAHKGDRPGWLSMDRKTAVLEVFYHMGKLHQAVHRDEAAAIREYAADVANMCMMLTDVCGCLDEFARLNK